MIRDLVREQPQPGFRADVCVVGAGAAGITMAVELARLGKTVVLLEAGGEVVEENAQQPARGVAVSRPHRGLHSGRVRALGGTTNLWGGQILELDDSDFTARPWVEGSGWPLSKDDVAPYYLRALEIEGLSNCIHEDRDVWRALGQQPTAFDGTDLYLSRWCPEPNFAHLHRKTLEESSRIDVWVHTNAVELLLEGEHLRGVRCRSQTGAECIFAATEYVFCLGAVESSRFFLQPRDGLLPWNSSGLLGHHFQDHIDCDAATVEPVSKVHFHAIFDAIFLRGFKYNPKLKLNDATQAAERLLHAGATFYSVSEMDGVLNDIKATAKRVLRGRWSDVSASELMLAARNSSALCKQSYRYAVEHRAYHPSGAQMKMRVHCEQEPSSASTITLDGERDEFGLFRTRISWTISRRELHTIRRFVEVAQRSLNGIAKIIPDERLMQPDNRFLDACEDSFHHMGGMRMNASSRQGVVDPSLKLHGVSNGYVCSSAVFPTSGFSNPTHTLLALAVRLAEHLART